MEKEPLSTHHAPDSFGEDKHGIKHHHIHTPLLEWKVSVVGLHGDRSRRVDIYSIDLEMVIPIPEPPCSIGAIQHGMGIREVEVEDILYTGC